MILWRIMMIKAFLYHPSTQKLEKGGKELIQCWHESNESILWLDIENEPENDEVALLEQFNLHPLAIQDSLRPRHPPKIERFDDFLFILLRGLEANNSGLNFGTIQLSLFIGERFLITRHIKPSVSTNWLTQELEKNVSIIQYGPSKLAVLLTNRLARRYIEILFELEPRLDEIEEEMFIQPDDKLLAELTSYKSQLRNLARIVNYHKTIANWLCNNKDSIIHHSLTHEIVDLYEQVERTQSLANMHYQNCTDLTDGYLGMASHQLNRVMQLLTIITVIFVPLTFMAGIYGMNFQNMPELSNPSGYFILLGVMLIVAILQIIYFRKKRWL